jgi:hypothetical protein
MLNYESLVGLRGDSWQLFNLLGRALSVDSALGDLQLK